MLPRRIQLKSLVPRDGDSNIGAIARRGLNLRSATDAVHPLHDGISDTVTVFGDGFRIKAGAAVANENGKLAGKVLGVDIDGVNTCMLAGIDHGFARSHHRELGVFRQWNILTNGNRADRNAEQVLNLTAGAIERSEDRLRSLLDRKSTR